jgi:hypothetical protein
VAAGADDRFVESGVDAWHAETHLLGDPTDRGEWAVICGHVVGHCRELYKADLRPRGGARERAVSARHHRSPDLVAGRVKCEPDGALKTAEQVVVLRDIREPRIRAGARAEEGIAWPA